MLTTPAFPTQSLVASGGDRACDFRETRHVLTLAEKTEIRPRRFFWDGSCK
jgi:hypothetical protein